MTKWWVLELYFIVLCSSLNKGKKSSISDSAQNVKAWHESWCIIIINLTFIVETMEQEVWENLDVSKYGIIAIIKQAFCPNSWWWPTEMETLLKTLPLQRLTKQILGIHQSQRVNFVPLPGCPFSPFPWEKSLETRFIQNEEKDWRLKRKMGAIGKVALVCFSSAKKTVRKRFFGDRFYAVK